MWALKVGGKLGEGGAIVFFCELDETKRTIFVGAHQNWWGGRVVADAAAGGDPYPVLGPLFQLVHQDVRLGRVDRDSERLRVRPRLLHHLNRQFPNSKFPPHMMLRIWI